MKFVLAESEIREEYTCPVLIWESPRVPREEAIAKTMAGASSNPFDGIDSRVIAVAPKEGGGARSSRGVSLGRAESCDLAVPEASVALLQGFLREDPATHQWKLVEAEGSTGVWLNGVRIAPDQEATVNDKDRLRLGKVELLFLLPDAFFEFLVA